MPKANLASVTADFTNILTAIEMNAADFIHMEAERLELRTLLPEITELSATQAALHARSQQTTKDIGEKVDRGLLLFTQLRSAVKAKYGTRSEKLTEFRLRPLTRKRRAAAPKVKPAPAAPAAPPEPTTPTTTP